MIPFNISYFTIALSISLFYGRYAVKIFMLRPEEYSKFPKREYQFIFNFLGGAYGFLILYYLLCKVILSIRTNNFSIINLGDMVLLTIAIVGTMGQLPGAVYTLTKNISVGMGSIREK